MPMHGFTRSRGNEFLTRAAAMGKLAAHMEAGAIRPTWDVSGRCQSPVYRTLTFGSYFDVSEGDYRTNVLTARERGEMRTIDLWVRCRRCHTCARARAALWRERARREVAAASRTWFGTLTLSPSSHHLIALRCRHRLNRGGTNFDALSDDEQFAERHREVSKELTKWIKRLRKNSGAKLRLIVVAERHKSGLPHYHALLHEVNETPLRHAVLAKSWPMGFTNFKLVKDARAASYVTKYLSKAATERVRASAHYGRQDQFALMAKGGEETPVNHSDTLPQAAPPGRGVYLSGCSYELSNEPSFICGKDANAAWSGLSQDHARAYAIESSTRTRAGRRTVETSSVQIRTDIHGVRQEGRKRRGESSIPPS